MSRSLVTGGAGFIGAHVTDHLIEMGHEVTVLDDLSGGFRENVSQKANFVEGSILDIELIEKLFVQGRFDYVYHLAAYAAEGLSHFIRRFNYQNNLIGSVNLINASINHGVERFIFTSSIATYGGAQSPMTEATIPQPEDPYGISKLAVEQDLYAAQEFFGLDYTIFRPHNVYGEKQNIGDRYRNVVGIFMNQALKGEPMTVFGDGEQVRAFSYIGDISPVIANCTSSPKSRNEVFNIGADEPYTVNELATVVARKMGVERRVVHLDARKEVVVAFSSHEKVEKVFGSSSRTTLEDGIEKMAEWARRHGARESSIFGKIEVSKNMPASWAAVARASDTPGTESE